MKFEKIIVFSIVIILLLTVTVIYNSSNDKKSYSAGPLLTNSIYALPEVLDYGIANHSSNQFNNISLSAGGSIYLYGATDGGGQPLVGENFSTIFFASNDQIGTNSVEGYSSNNGAIVNYPSPISQKAIGGISIGYPNAINSSVGRSTEYFQALGDVQNTSKSSMNFYFNITGGEKLAVFFIEGSNYKNPEINANFQIYKLSELNGPLLFMYLGYSTLYPGFYKINLKLSMAMNNSLACDSILGVYIFPELYFTTQVQQKTYPVTFMESGLPAGTYWGITINGTTFSSSSNTLNFNEPNGSYYYRVIVPSGFTAKPLDGTFTVSGFSVSMAISFSKALKGPYRITFTETGLPAGTEWVVESPSTFMYNSTNNTLIFYEPNGTYFYEVFTYTNYYASIPQGNFTVQGGPVNISVIFSTNISQEYLVSFYAKGLPDGLSWSVTFNNETKTSTNDYINFTAPNGLYSWSYTLPSPYYSTITPEKITVDNQGGDIIIPVLSTKTVTPSAPGNSNLILIILVVIIIIVIILILLILMRRRRPRQYGQGPGYYGQQGPSGSPPNYPPQQQTPTYYGPQAQAGSASIYQTQQQYPGPYYVPTNQEQLSNQNIPYQNMQQNQNFQGTQNFGQDEMLLLNIPGARLTTIDGRKISTISYSGSIVITDRHFIFASKGKKATALTGALTGGIFTGMISKEMTKVDLSNIKQELSEPGSFILDLSSINFISAKPSGLSKFSEGKLNIISKVPVSPNGLSITGYAFEFSFMPKGYPGGTDLKKEMADYINTTIAKMVGK
ncbi:MAG: hypothetical protein ACP5F1_05600 [Thermoplasmata archaeon]